MRILLLEDEINIQKLIKLNLEMEGYEVESTIEGRKAIQLSKEQHFDLIILDVMLPDISGIEVCERIRLENHSVPIIFVSAKDSSIDRINGLRAGADDYLAKPFNLEELILRITKLIRRSSNGGSGSPENYEFGGNHIDFLTFEAVGQNGPFSLTKREVMLLKLLIERENKVVSRQQILQVVWGYDVFPSTRTIDNYILSFRKYFEKDQRDPQHFLSVRGVGYKFVG